MTSGEDALSVLLVLHTDPETDREFADQLVRRLRNELIELDVDSVAAPAAGTVPDGAKGVDPVTVGALLVALSASGGVLPTMIGTLRDWLERQAGRHRIAVTIDGDVIELERATAEERRDLLEAYIRRHSGE
ncbi:effector-associated constant component EACC1 [Nonomuraea wenchangensis]|uniref:effector-associated constant component EACC1 n=1 Tax=Nonomuraea wenchangensis TaxID=568860 RepID=UPI00333485EB